MSRLVIAALAGCLASCLAGCPAAQAPPCEGAVCAPFPVGSSPNDAALTTCDGQPVVVVTESGDARVTTYAVPAGTVVASAALPDVSGNAADPWAVVVDETHGLAVVTLNGQDGLAVIDPCTGRVASRAAVNGVSKPEPVVFDGARFVVGFTNVLHTSTSPADPPVVDPGVVASFTLDGEALVAGPAVTLPCKNPQGLVVDGADVWASCSGPLGPDGALHQRAVEDGALVKLLGDDLAVGRVIDAARLAPGTPAVLGDAVVAGSIVTPDLLAAGPGDDTLAPVLHLEGPDVDSIFEVARWDEHTLLVPQFSKDAIFVVDVTDPLAPVQSDAVNGVVQAGPGGAAFHGLLTLDVRKGFGDVDAAAVFALSSELAPLRLHEVLP